MNIENNHKTNVKITNRNNDFDDSKFVSISFVEKDHNLRSLIEFALSHTNHKDIDFTNSDDLWRILTMPNMRLVAFNTADDEIDDEFHQKKVKIRKKISISYKKRRVKVNGQDMHFTKQEFDILGLLYDYRGQIVSKDSILEHIWGLSYTKSNIVATTINNIRRKLGKYAKIIETVRGVGYILND